MKGKTKEELLRVTIAEIEKVGEGNVRLEDVLREAEASVSSLYHHFGNMRGLLDEAQLARFNASTGDNTKRFRDAANRVKNRKELRELIKVTIEITFSSKRAHSRFSAMNAFGSIFETAGFHDRVAEIERENMAVLVDALDSLRARELISESLDLHAFAAWIMGLTFSRVVPDLLNDPATEEAWVQLTTQAVIHLMEV